MFWVYLTVLAIVWLICSFSTFSFINCVYFNEKIDTIKKAQFAIWLYIIGFITGPLFFIVNFIIIFILLSTSVIIYLAEKHFEDKEDKEDKIEVSKKRERKSFNSVAPFIDL